jgi:hypothetical protein
LRVGVSATAIGFIGGYAVLAACEFRQERPPVQNARVGSLSQR